MLYFKVVKSGRIERPRNPFPKKLARNGGPHGIYEVKEGELFTGKEMIKIDLLDDWYIGIDIPSSKVYFTDGSRYALKED